MVCHQFMYSFFRGGRVIKDILCTLCYSGSLAPLEKQSLFPLEISSLSFLNLHSWTFNFGFCKYSCFFRMCFVQWVLRWFHFNSQRGLNDTTKSLGLFFFCQDFLSRTLKTHRTAGEERGPSYSILPLPPAHLESRSIYDYLESKRIKRNNNVWNKHRLPS